VALLAVGFALRIRSHFPVNVPIITSANAPRIGMFDIGSLPLIKCASADAAMNSALLRFLDVCYEVQHGEGSLWQTIVN
jgi:hypothetical protein